ncbi:MAG: hypothetical protein A2583_11495 [Bdellovibrionales bacterium RIFOXYD1_FULL_53_11]|nr:MAG: hypothetical protein A2583_11495 [Bdellovibrionales bacterium RIFOXYD1_FULL_53_11]
MKHRWHNITFNITLNLIFIITTATAGMASAPQKAPLHFVFDMDDTLIRWIRPNEKVSGTVIPAIGDIGGYRYRVLDGAPELIASLLKDHPGVKISFYSNGDRTRNHIILKELKLPDGRPVFDIAHKIFSNSDVEKVPAAAAPRQNNGYGIFNSGTKEYWKKDLKKIVSDGESTANVVLIDDNPAFVKKGQEKNLLFAGKKPDAHLTAINELGNKSVEKFFTDRAKLARVRGIIDRAYELARTEGIFISDALWKIQWTTNNAGNLSYREELLRDMKLYRRGFKRLRSVNPSFRLATAIPGTTPLGCTTRHLRQILKNPQ